MTLLTRFAPSPTGLLHLGHAYAAERAFSFGPCLLRIEDIDHTRVRAEFEPAMIDDLRWLGFDWPEPTRRQSEHLQDYAAVVSELTDRGLTYEDYRTRSGEDDRSRPPAVKLSTEAAARALAGEALTYTNNGEVVSFRPSTLADPTIARRDIGVSYHIAVTHDDQIQDVTDVVRGEDLLPETPVHVLIQALMGWRVPAYHHHGLVWDGERKMSKRRGSRTIASLREAGLSPADVLAQARTSKASASARDD